MTEQPLRIVFAGTPEFAAGHLECLVNSGFHVVAVYTQPDRPTGRGKKILPPPVKAAALARGIPVLQPEKLAAADLPGLAALAPDVMVVVAYGQILDQAILDIPRYGCINVHASLLPRWRGAAPIERAILAGDKETGISIMQMDAGLDTGAVLLQLATTITNEDNAGSVAERLLALGCRGLETVLRDLAGCQARAQAQESAHVTYAAKLTKDDAVIRWDKSALDIQHQVQALVPRSPAFCWYRGERIRILQAVRLPGHTDQPPGTLVSTGEDAILVACGEDALSIGRVQLPGKSPASIRDILNGHPDFFLPGQRLASAEIA